VPIGFAMGQVSSQVTAAIECWCRFKGGKVAVAIYKVCEGNRPSERAINSDFYRTFAGIYDLAIVDTELQVD
jgi:hypothetical protein